MTLHTWSAAGAAGRAVLVAAVAALGAGCDQGDPVSVAGGQQGAALLIAATPLNASLPAGVADVRTDIDFDLTLRDAFSRQPTSAVHGRKGRYYRNNLGEWLYPSDTTGPARRGSGPMLDPRYPFLAPDGPRTNHLRIFDPFGNGDDYYNPFFNGSLTGLKPSTPYTIVLVHYRLKVVGELDHVERIMTGAVTEPDSLLLPPGSTYQQTNSNWTAAAPAGCVAYPGPTANPYSYAQITSSATGTSNPDKCFLSGNGIAGVGDFDDPAKSLIGRSDDTPYALPSYNYWELWEGPYGTGAPVIRIQLAQDLDLQGNPIANAFPPFPAPRTTGTQSGQQAPPPIDQAATYPAPFSVQIALPGAFGVPDSVVLSLSNVQELGDGQVYKVWYVNRTTGVAKAAPGHFVRVVDNDTVATGDNTATFNGGPGTIIFVAPAYSDVGQPDVSDSLSFLLVTTEATAAAAQPSMSQPLWVGIIKLPGRSVGGAVTFGDFNFVPNAAGGPGEPFVPQGRLAGGVLGDTTTIFVDTTITEDGVTRTVRVRRALFIGSTLELRFTQLMRPPVGYEYRGFLVPKSEEAELVDAGGLQDSNGGSLTDADVAPVSPNLTASQIHAAKLTFDVSANAPADDTLCDYLRFQLYLVPKGGSRPPATLIFDTLLPERLRTARSCR